MAFIYVDQPARTRLASMRRVSVLDRPLHRDQTLVAMIMAGVRCIVSEAYGPLRPSLDAGPSSSAAQRQGMSSSMRLLGQPLTRRVSTSVK
jgi:hypothetical protein